LCQNFCSIYVTLQALFYQLQFLTHTLRAIAQCRNLRRKCRIDVHQGLYESTCAAKTSTCFTHNFVLEMSERLESLRVDSRNSIGTREIGHVDAPALLFVSLALDKGAGNSLQSALIRWRDFPCDLANSQDMTR
jgi:hypothetical protein